MKFKLRKEDRTDVYGRRIDPNWDEEGQNRRYKKSYEEYFEGYTEKEEVSRSGKKVSVRVYTGTRYKPELTDAQRRQKKALYCFLMVMALVLNIWALCLPIWSNYNIWTFLFGCVPAVVYIRVLFALMAYLFAGPELKIFEYRKGAQVLAKTARPSLIAAGAAIISVPVVLLVFRQHFAAAELLRMAMIAMSALLAAYVEVTEKKINYTVIPETK